MDETTIVDDQEDRSTDPARFAAMRAHEVPETRPWSEVLGSAAALLALVVGLPVALIVLAGVPTVPSGVPTLHDFARQLSVEDLLTVLVAVVWLAWLWFVVCVGVEVVAARRGGLARPVPLAGPLQHLARVLVGALLLTGIVTGPAQAASEVVAAPPATTTSAAVGLVDAELPDVQEASQTVAVDEPGDQAAEDAGELVGKKVYTVQAPEDGYHDNLWDIAERHLGDGRRYHEIYELNKNRSQPDGRQLELARLIQPGWDLVMPDDASGVDRVRATGETPDASTSSESAGPGTDGAGGAASDAAAAATPGGVADGSGAMTVQDLMPWATGVGLLSAGVLAALTLRRRRGGGRPPGGDALDVEADLRVAAATDRADRLDRVLRHLTAQCREDGTTPPQAYGAVVDDASVELLLAPPTPHAVTGWETLDEGRRWRCTDEDGAAPTEVVPYPALVGLGVDPDGRDVLVDLEAAGGIVAVTGDPTVSSEVAVAMAVQAATAPWSDVVRVTASGLPEGIADVSDDRLEVADLSDRLDAWEDRHRSGVGEVLTGRMGRRGRVPTDLVVSGAVPETSVAQRLSALVGGGRQPFSVVVAGDHMAARWRLHVDSHGSLSVPQMNLTVEANRVSAAQVGAVAELFTAAREVDDAGHDERVPVPAPTRRHDDADWATAAARVAVLGDVVTRAPGELDDSRIEVATELVAYLALHPDGVHPTVLAGAVWPRGVTTDVRDAAVERARAWLSTDVDGNHRLRAGSDGQLSLADSVVCDWDCARTLFLRSRAAATPREEADLLLRALKLARGEAFGDAPQGRYAWVAREDVPRVITQVVVDGALRLAAIRTDDDDPTGAAAAVELGLRVSSGDQRLWRSLLRSRHAETGTAGVRRTLDEMGDALTGLPIEAETEALIDELMPDTGSLPSSG